MISANLEAIWGMSAKVKYRPEGTAALYGPKKTPPLKSPSTTT